MRNHAEGGRERKRKGMGCEGKEVSAGSGSRSVSASTATTLNKSIQEESLVPLRSQQWTCAPRASSETMMQYKAERRGDEKRVRGCEGSTGNRRQKRNKSIHTHGGQHSTAHTRTYAHTLTRLEMPHRLTDKGENNSVKRDSHRIHQ